MKLTLDQILSIRHSIGVKLDNGLISLSEYKSSMNYYDGLISRLVNK